MPECAAMADKSFRPTGNSLGAHSPPPNIVLQIVLLIALSSTITAHQEGYPVTSQFAKIVPASQTAL